MPATFRFRSRDDRRLDADRVQRGGPADAARTRSRRPRGCARRHVTRAKAELDALGRALAKQYPDDNDGETATLTPMSELGVVQLRPTLIALSGAVALVLLIACVNVANLLLAQSLLAAARVRRPLRARRLAVGALPARCCAKGSSSPCSAARRARRRVGRQRRCSPACCRASIVYAPFRDAGSGIQLDPWVLGFTAAHCRGRPDSSSAWRPSPDCRRARTSRRPATAGHGPADARPDRSRRRRGRARARRARRRRL